MARLLMALFILGLIASAGAWFLAENYQSMREVGQLADNMGDLSLEGNLNADLSLESITLTHAGEGALAWTLNADRASYVLEDDLIHVENPTISYMHEPGAEPVVVSAEFGEVRQDRRDVRLWNTVLVRYEDKTVSAESLVYDDEDKTLILEGGVTLESERASCSSPRMVVDLASNRFTMENGVLAEILLDSFALDGAEEQGSQ